MNREMKVFMFAALAILMASACFISIAIDESEAADRSSTSSKSWEVGDSISNQRVSGPGNELYDFGNPVITGSVPGITISYGDGNKASYIRFDGSPTTAGSYTVKAVWTCVGSYGSGTAYSAGDKYTLTVSVTVTGGTTPAPSEYTCYLYYNANGGSGAPSTQSYTGTSTSSHSFTVSSSTPSRSGYTFLGWSTSSSASSASYTAGSSISVSYNGSKTLYAVWQEQVSTYSVTVYKGNWDSFKWVGGSDTTKYTSSSHTYTVTSGASLDIDWYGKSSESGSGTDYSYTTTYTSSNYNMATSLYGTSLGDSVTITSGGKYYPAVQMSSNTTYTYNFTIKYNANGGSGAPSDTTATNSSTTKSITLSSTTPTRSGYTFLGWSTSSSASSASYNAGSSYTFNYGTTQLYAVWKAATITVTGTPDSYGVVGTAWSFKPTVSESGCTVTISGASWLSANGNNVSGTPTSPGTYNVTLTFSKTGFTSATKTFSVTVLSALDFESSPTGGAIIYAV